MKKKEDRLNTERGALDFGEDEEKVEKLWQQRSYCKAYWEDAIAFMAARAVNVVVEERGAKRVVV